MFTGRLNSKPSETKKFGTKGLSRKRAIRIFCRSCNGGSTRAGCPDFCCEFYPWLPEHRQLAGPPDLWWVTSPANELDRAEMVARLQKRKIKKEDLFITPDSEDEDDLDEDEDEDQVEE